MLEVSTVGVAESDDEIELSLELSLGRSYGKLKKLKQAEDSGKENDKGLKAVVPRSGFSFPGMVVGDQMDTESGSGSEVVDSRRKREIQALRRQEAMRKREEKLRKSAANSKGINAGAFAVGIANANDKVVLETQQFQARVRDREMTENDALLEEKIAKFNRNENGKDSNFTFRNDRTGSKDRVSGSKRAVSFLQNVPVKKRPCPHPQLQCVPQKNGFVYPPMVPCRGPRVIKEENDTNGRNIFQPVSCGSFRPYPNGNRNLKRDSVTGGCDSERDSAKSESGIPKVMSNGSLKRSSSAISEHPSTSGKGGSSSETGSHSSCFRTNEQQLGVSSINFDRMAQPGSIACAGKRELGQDPRKSADRSCMAEVSRNDKTVATPKCDEPSTSTSRPSSGNKGTLVPTLPRMPCVSTTGNGPNGKTITGFLYRYRKTEVSIVCVCHGSSFSPAEFVEHAGGTDVTNPLRHITMVPSSFGD